MGTGITTFFVKNAISEAMHVMVNYDVKKASANANVLNRTIKQTYSEKQWMKG